MVCVCVRGGGLGGGSFITYSQVISGYEVVEAISRVKTKSENPVRDAARCTTGKFKSRFEV